MAAETLGEACALGWKLTVRCAAGRQEAMHRHRECVHGARLDMETLVWTRGKAFPLSKLASCLRCTRSGSRQVVVLYDMPARAASGDVG